MLAFTHAMGKVYIEMSLGVAVATAQPRKARAGIQMLAVGSQNPQVLSRAHLARVGARRAEVSVLLRLFGLMAVLSTEPWWRRW